MSEERGELPGADFPGAELPGAEPGEAQLANAERGTWGFCAAEHGPLEGGTAEPPRTGLDPVDRVLAREAEIAGLPVTERAAAYEALHAALERILEERPGALPSGLTAGATGSSDTGRQGGAGDGRADEQTRPGR